MFAAFAGGAVAMLPPARAAAFEFTPSEHRIALRNVHNGESYDILFGRGSNPLPEGIAELKHALRDWRNGAVHPIDFELAILATRLRDRLDVDPRRPIDVISGYRSPATNMMLRANSDGVAQHSQHLVGKAMDVAIPGVELMRIRDAALALRGGGVGYYPSSGFVHIDTGPIRRW